MISDDLVFLQSEVTDWFLHTLWFIQPRNICRNCYYASPCFTLSLELKSQHFGSVLFLLPRWAGMSCLSCHASFQLWRRCLLKSMRIWRPRNWRGTWRKYSGKSVQPRHDRNLWNFAHLSAIRGSHPDFFIGFWVLWSRARQMRYADMFIAAPVHDCLSACVRASI